MEFLYLSSLKDYLSLETMSYVHPSLWTDSLEKILPDFEESKQVRVRCFLTIPPGENVEKAIRKFQKNFSKNNVGLGEQKVGFFYQMESSCILRNEEEKNNYNKNFLTKDFMFQNKEGVFPVGYVDLNKQIKDSKHLEYISSEEMLREMKEDFIGIIKALLKNPSLTKEEKDKKRKEFVRWLLLFKDSKYREENEYRIIKFMEHEEQVYIEQRRATGFLILENPEEMEKEEQTILIRLIKESIQKDITIYFLTENLMQQTKRWGQNKIENFNSYSKFQLLHKTSLLFQDKENEKCIKDNKNAVEEKNDYEETKRESFLENILNSLNKPEVFWTALPSFVTTFLFIIKFMYEENQAQYYNLPKEFFTFDVSKLSYTFLFIILPILLVLMEINLESKKDKKRIEKICEGYIEFVPIFGVIVIGMIFLWYNFQFLPQILSQNLIFYICTLGVFIVIAIVAMASCFKKYMLVRRFFKSLLITFFLIVGGKSIFEVQQNTYEIIEEGDTKKAVISIYNHKYILFDCEIEKSSNKIILYRDTPIQKEVSPEYKMKKILFKDVEIRSRENAD